MRSHFATNRFRRHILCHALAIAIGVGVTATNAHAQELVERKVFDVTAQPAASALNTFAEQADITLVFSNEAVSGLVLQPLKGQYSTQEALAVMLQGSGLSWQNIDQSTVSIVAEEAQIKAEDDAVNIDGVTVYGRYVGQTPGGTATKSTTPVLETPFSVSVVTRELLDLRAVSNIGEAVETISSVTRTIGFSGNQSFRIRGFQAISYLRDGYRQSISQPEVDLQGVESIEVLKGPASALYGRFEPGGVINFISKRPENHLGTNLSLTAGSNEYLRVGADVTGPLNQSRTLLGRVNFAYEDAGSFRDLIDNKQIFVSPVIEYRPDDRTSITARLEYFHRDNAFDRGLGNNPIFLQVPISRNYGEEYMRMKKEQWAASFDFSREINDSWRYKLGGYYSKVDVPEESFFNYGFPAVSGTSVNRNFSSFKEKQVDKTVQAELYGGFETGAVRHKLLAGVEYTSDNLSWIDAKALFGAPPIDLLDPVRTGPAEYDYFEGNTNVDLETYAAYVQNEMAWNKWRLLLGGRFEKTRTTTYSELYVNPAVTREDTPFSPRAGITFMATPNLSFYASWARSFRNEGASGLLEDESIPVPTIGIQKEIGAKALLFGGLGELTLSAFDLEKRNAIVPSPTDPSRVIQTGELVSRGVEVELSTRPTDAWTLVTAYAYADTEIASDTNGWIVGNRMAGIPRHQASLWTSWKFGGLDLTGLTIGGGIFYSGAAANTTANTFYLPSYARVDLNAAYMFRNQFEVRLNLDNVTDERIYITGGFSQMYPQPPRSVRLTLSKRW